MQPIVNAAYAPPDKAGIATIWRGGVRVFLVLFCVHPPCKIFFIFCVKNVKKTTFYGQMVDFTPYLAIFPDDF